MKNTLFLTFAILLVLQFNFVTNDCSGDASKVEDCQSKTLGTGEYKCCLYEAEWDGGSGSGCVGVTKEEYDDIDDYIDKLEEAGDEADLDIDIDCGSNYLLISLLSLILLFL